MVDATMYRQMIGSLMYLRLDICFAVSTLRHVHLMVTKHAGVQLIMGSSMMQIRRLTWRVMLIHIRQAVPSIEEHFRVLLQYGIRCDLLV